MQTHWTDANGEPVITFVGPYGVSGPAWKNEPTKVNP